MTSSNINWRPGDIIALSEDGVRIEGISWDKASVVRVDDDYSGNPALLVARRLDLREGLIPMSAIKGRWIIETGGAPKLTGLQRLVMRRLRVGPASCGDIAIFIGSSCASARSRITELRKMGYRISVEKATRTYTLEK